MPDLNDLPPELQKLISDLLDAVVDITGELEMSLDYVVEWQNEMERLLTRYHTAAYMAGQGSAILAADDMARIAQIVAAQIAFLDNFVAVIQDSDTFERGWKARAAMYAEAVSGSYWRGKVRMLPAPAVPGDGTTQCKSRCRCWLEQVEIDGDKGDWDLYWRLGPVKTSHCQTCLQRAADWNPLRIRNGELVV